MPVYKDALINLVPGVYGLLVDVQVVSRDTLIQADTLNIAGMFSM